MTRMFNQAGREFRIEGKYFACTDTGSSNPLRGKWFEREEDARDYLVANEAQYLPQDCISSWEDDSTMSLHDFSELFCSECGEMLDDYCAECEACASKE